MKFTPALLVIALTATAQCATVSSPGNDKTLHVGMTAPNHPKSHMKGDETNNGKTLQVGMTAPNHPKSHMKEQRDVADTYMASDATDDLEAYENGNPEYLENFYDAADEEITNSENNAPSASYTPPTGSQVSNSTPHRENGSSTPLLPYEGAASSIYVKCQAAIAVTFGVAVFFL